ncbi:phage protein NinX family protein [Morganella morganii]|uniref:phage protein NinX family protein n=1 Tax=Morganella morganii TaxID=582 RepID=UPI0024C437F0|nr:phage protein NinX family protein [Morganella morganii]WHZ52283.1 DUF2591 family protein [Morganella morganii]
MNKYRDKSDFEINKAVAVNINGTDAVVEKFGRIYISDSDAMVSFDPCNNPYDAMPIIFDNNISLILSHNEYPLATNNPSGLFRDALPPENVVTNKNPLRAAMELFLMMKDAENEKV